MRTLRTIELSLMVYDRVSEEYILFALMYTKYHIFLVIPIKDMINKDDDPTMPFKLVIGTKTSLPHLCLLFFPCVVQKSDAHVGTKALKMRFQAQKSFRGIFIGIPQHQKG